MLNSKESPDYSKIPRNFKTTPPNLAAQLSGTSSKILNPTATTINPIRSGLFQTANDPGASSLYDLENYFVNRHHIIHVHFTKCFGHVPIKI